VGAGWHPWRRHRPAQRRRADGAGRPGGAATADPATRQRLAKLGLEIPPPQDQSPEALGALQKAEIDKWWPVIKAAGIKAQ